MFFHSGIFFVLINSLAETSYPSPCTNGGSLKAAKSLRGAGPGPGALCHHSWLLLCHPSPLTHHPGSYQKESGICCLFLSQLRFWFLYLCVWLRAAQAKRVLSAEFSELRVWLFSPRICPAPGYFSCSFMEGNKNHPSLCFLYLSAPSLPCVVFTDYTFLAPYLRYSSSSALLKP